MLKRTVVMTSVLLVAAGVAFAGVNVNIGIPVPTVKVVEKQTVVVKGSKDNGKHLGHNKDKGGKKKHK